MNEDNYLSELIGKTNIKYCDIFNYEDSPYKDDFRSTIDFYKKTLEILQKFGIGKSYLFFENNTNTNARAKTHNGNGIISITAGLMIEYVTKYKSNEQIDTFLQEQFAIILPYVDNKLNVLIYQYLLHATFYHEVGHLIQQSKKQFDDWHHEQKSSQPFSLLQHSLEIDADTFSAISCASHILQYAEKIFKEDLSTEKTTLLVELFLTGFYLYYLSMPSAKNALYYEEYSHPHPLIRILNASLTCVDYLNKNSKLIEFGIKLDPLSITQNVIHLGTYIEKEILRKEETIDFLKVLTDNRSEIVQYFTKLRAQNFEDFYSAVNKRNESI